jgi:hypothetical protein
MVNLILSRLMPLSASSAEFNGSGTLIIIQSDQNYTNIVRGEGTVIQYQGNGTVSNASALNGVVSNTGSGTITLAEGTGGRLYNLSDGSIGTGTALLGQIINAGTGSMGTVAGLDISSALNVGGGSINTMYGIIVRPQTAATNNYGIAVGSASTQTLWVNNTSNSTTAAGGIAFGSSRDTNLYRSAANTLTTDGSLTVGNALTGSAVALTVNNSTSTGNILNLQDNGTNVMTVADGGAVTFQNTANSTTALRVLNQAGDSVFNVNTTNGRVGIGTAAPTGVLSIYRASSGTDNPIYVNAGTGWSGAIIELQSSTTARANGILLTDTAATADSAWFMGSGYASQSFMIGNGNDFCQNCSTGAYIESNAALTITRITKQVGIGTASPEAKLQVTGTNTATPVIIARGVGSQTADLQQWQNNSGTTLAAVDAGGRFVAPNLGSGDTTTYLCRNSSNQIATCTAGAGSAFVDGGNSFGATAVLGTNDNYNLEIETNGTTRLTIDTSGNATLATGQLRVADGSAATPSYSFTTDTDTGIYSAGANQLGFATEGVNRLTVSNGGVQVADRLQVGSEGGTLDQCLIPGFGLLTCNVGLEVARISSTNTANITIGINAITTINPTSENSAPNFGTLSGLGLLGNQSFSGNNYGVRGIASGATTAGTISNLIGVSGSAVQSGSGSTVTNAIALQGEVQRSAGTLTNAFGLQILSATGTITNNYGIQVQAQTAGTNNYGIAIGSASTQTLWVNSTSNTTTAAGGIAFGSSRDTTLYRSGAGILETGGDFYLAREGNRTLRVANTTSSNTVGGGLTVGAGNGTGTGVGGALTLQSGTGGASAAGGDVVIQSGNSGGGNNNGGNINITAGAGTGTGVTGLVIINTPTYSTVTNANCSSNCTIAQANVDSYAAIIVNATAIGVTVDLPDPTLSTAGRVIYITAANGSEDFTLSVNGGGQGNEIAMRQNTTATMIWSGSEWTAAGASSSTTLQAAYDNTLTAAGGAEIVLNNTASSNGLTVRNNADNPIIGALFETQTSVGSNLFSVNNNAAEFASNGGAENSNFGAWGGVPTAGGTVTRHTTIGDYVATGQASVRIVTGADVLQGAANTLATTLTPNLRYTVSFTVRGETNFETLGVVYSRDGTLDFGNLVVCTEDQRVTTGSWTRITCSFTANASGITSSNAIFIGQSDATARTFYIDNLSVTVSANVNHAADGDVDDVGNFSTNWQATGGATVTRSTSTIYNTSGSTEVETTAVVGDGVRNNMAITPSVNTQYLVTLYARSSNTFNDIRVRYTRDGGTSFVECVDYNTRSVSTSTWTRVTCLFTTDGSAPTNADLVIDQPTATARTFWVDAVSVTLNTNTASNVQIGGGNLGGPVTLLTLDRSAGPPVADNNDAYLGSMYFDTVTGRIQCYEAGGWGTCGAPPDNIVNLNPEYAGAVLNGTGVGTMSADFCADEVGVLSVNDSLCDNGQALNYYRWTSPQATQQTYSIYVTYQLPSTFNGFANDDTVQLTARRDSSNAAVTYEMFRSQNGSLTKCGTGETTVTTSDNTWQTVGINGNEATGCGFNSSSANSYVIFKINVKAQDNANAFVSTLSFTTTGR